MASEERDRPLPSAEALKARVIEALLYPRKLMRGAIDLETCTHAGNYAPRDRACRACAHEIECGWLIHHDEHVDLYRRSVASLTESLELGHAYVDARVTLAGHDSARCRCAACEWLQDAERLLDALR